MAYRGVLSPHWSSLMLRLRPAAAVAMLQCGAEAESWNSGLKESE